MKMKRWSRRSFTLIEMLMVLVIISLLVGILLPALHVAKVRAKKNKTKAELDQIVKAWNAYLLDYRRFPSMAINQMGPEAIEILRASGTNGWHDAENPRGYRYMEFRSGTEYFCDPWGDASSTNAATGVYRVRLDKDLDNKVRVGGVGGQDIYLSVVAWACGPNNKDDNGKVDDLVSWEKK